MVRRISPRGSCRPAARGHPGGPAASHGMRNLAWRARRPARIDLTGFSESFATWVPYITELANAEPSREGPARARGGVLGSRRGRWIASATQRFCVPITFWRPAALGRQPGPRFARAGLACGAGVPWVPRAVSVDPSRIRGPKPYPWGPSRTRGARAVPRGAPGAYPWARGPALEWASRGDGLRRRRAPA